MAYDFSNSHANTPALNDTITRVTEPALKGLKIAKILEVAETIERSPDFSMSTWVHPCGTPACIAGHTLKPEEAVAWSRCEVTWDIEYRAARRLGLKAALADQLFVPGNQSLREITNAHAAACLRKLAATGIVDWEGTKP